MVRKSKRKQTIVAFEKSLLPIPIHLARYESIASPAAQEPIQTILKLLTELSVCETQNQQIKLLQEAKPSLKNILFQASDPVNHEVNIKTFKLLVHLLCDPSHIWFRKYLEWLLEALMKSSLLSSSDIRQCVRDVCVDLLNICQREENLLDCTIDRCFEWINTFQWMNQFDKEISWIDDAEWVTEQGCWNSSVWPAGQDLGDGTLLTLLNAMEPLLRRCATVLDVPQQLEEEPEEAAGEEVGEENRRSSTELMRFAECAGECMRVLSAILKPRRGAVISPLDRESCANPEEDRWSVVSGSVLYHGCKILSSDLVSKDVLTSTALSVINIQWLLRVRLWEQAESTYRHRQRTVSEVKVVEDADSRDLKVDATDPGLSTGLQLIALLGLLRLDPKSNAKSSEKHPDSIAQRLLRPYAHLVGISPVLVNSLTSSEERTEPIIPYLSRCALLRACLSVFDLSALMFQPLVESNESIGEELKSALAYVVTSNQIEGNQIRYSPSNMITPTEVEKVASYIVSDMIPAHIRSTPDLLELYTSSGLFFGIVFEITSSLCLESATPTLRLYGLQTMETWLGRIETENLCVRVGTDDIITGRDGQPVSIGSKILRNMLISRLASISLLLTKTWSHPAKLVNHMVPVVYQRVVDLNHQLDAMMQSRSLVGGPDNPDIWEPFISNALNQPVEHRGRYQALSALLPNVGGQRLLQLHPQIFRSLILSMRVRDVGSSVGSFFGNLLRSLFADALLTPHSIRKMYLTDVAEALCSSEYKLRVNTADYLIPELLVIDALSGPLLIEKLRKVAAQKGCSFVQSLWGIVSVVLHARLLGKAGGDISDSDTAVLMTTAEDPSRHWRPLNVHEIEAVCLSEDIDLRLAGLAALTASQKTVHPLPDLELRILRKTLPYSLKSPLSDIRQRVLRVLRILITRLKESYRSCIRDLKKAVVHRHKDAQNQSFVIQNCNQDNGVLLAKYILKLPSADPAASAPVPSSSTVATAAPESEKKLASVAVTIIETLEWLSAIILANIYPGAPNDREMMALEMLRCILNGITGNISSGFGEKMKNSHVTSSQDDKILESALLSHFYSKPMTQSLLNLLISSWDKTRSLAAEILLLMPRPLPGYDTPAAVASLWRWGCKLSGSAKQRESDSGALLLRVINVIYSLDLRWITFIDSQTDANCKGDTLPPEETSSKSSETSAFISRLCDILDARLGELSAVFDAISATSQGRYPGESTPLSLPPLPSMLSHGLVLTLKYCLEDVNSNGLLVPSSGASPDQQKGRPRKKNKKQSPPSTVATNAEVNWRDTVQRVMKLALRSLQSALQIVAETPMDNYFAPVPKADAGKDHLLQDSAESTACQGEEQREVANTHGYASDSFMLNTNIFMDLEEPSDGLSDSKEDSIGRRMQFAVVGAWLLVKESCSLLAKLVEISPPLFVDPMGEESAADSNSTTLLTIEEIAHIGNVILDALSRLKHNGAIAEAQVSLQSVCESVLKYSGRSNVSLSHLPLTWLHNLINKLNGEQQVFILRRSAGFAFSFLSLLRSEPKNCKPVLLPLAMEVLFSFAAKGCVGGIDDQLSTDPPLVDVMEGVAWRTIVHSLNILRLIILDATLGPDLHPFIAQATKIAVRGFQSPLWAIRNSSMMVFSAIVQRTIDNDKKESGGRRAATPREFFLRYPTLFPFILRELARIVGAVIEFDEKGSPCNVMVTLSSSQQLTETNPSLYPILLMLSKMRTDTLESVPPTTKLPQQRKGIASASGDDDELGSLTPIGDENCNIDLFIPLVQLCASQKLFQVRVMAAKALSSLVPLQKVPEEIATILQPVIDSFQESSPKSKTSASSTKRFCSNLLHGSLLQVWDLVSNLHWYMSGDSASMGTNEVLYSSIASNLDTLVISKLVRLQQVMISAAVSNETAGQLQAPSCFHSHFPYAPIILLTFKRIVSVVYRVYSNDILSELLVKICEMNVLNLLPTLAGDGEEEHDKQEATALQAAKVPFAPLLWKESLVDLTKQTFRTELVRLYPALATVYGKTLRPEMTQPTSRDHHSMSMSRLLKLFQHPISEVREGVLLGSLDSFVEIIELDVCGSQDLPTKNVLIASFLTLALGSETQDQSFLTLLFRRIITEFEPPILQITLQLILDISLWTPFSSLDEDTKEDCLNSFRTLLQVSCGTYDPDTMLDFLDQTIDKSTRSRFVEQEPSNPPEEETSLTIAPTMAASYALQILGWMVRSFFESSIVNWPQAEEGRLPFGCLLPESECGPRVSRDRDDDESVLMCYSWHVWSWLRLVELAGVGEGCNVDSRYAAAKSLMSSKALFWATRSSIDGIRQPTDEKFGRYSGGGAFACRIWTLALKMLQDDDSDVRNVVTSAVGTAAKLAAVLAPELEAWFTHKLTSLPTTVTPIYDEVAVESMEGVMKPFVPPQGAEKSKSNEGNTRSPTQTAVALSRVQWTQGLIMEQISLPFSLAILWSLIQHKQQGAVSDWVTEVSPSPETQNPRDYLLSKAHLLSPSSLLLIDHWIDSFHTEDQHAFLPTNTQSGEGQTSSPIEVPDKIFEADQSNLFEESTVFASALSFSMGCATTLLPCSRTLPISTLLCQAATQALTVLQEYLQQQQSLQESHKGDTDPTALWLGGLTYHPVLYGKIYNSLIGAAHLCHLYREGRPSFSSSLTLTADPIAGSTPSPEEQARAALFPLLLVVITKAKRLMIQLRTHHGDEEPRQAAGAAADQERGSCLIHPSIISLLVDICGPPSAPRL